MQYSHGFVPPGRSASNSPFDPRRLVSPAFCGPRSAAEPARLPAHGLSGGLLALSRLRRACRRRPQAAPRRRPPASARSPRDARILAAIAERMTFTGDPACRASRDTAGPADHRRGAAAAAARRPAAALLRSAAVRVRSAAVPGRALDLHRPDAEWQDVYLDGWARAAASSTRRIAFQALKNLSMLGYYAQDATWKGIHYDGPWAPRPG